MLYRKLESIAGSLTERKERCPIARLDPMMPCDTAFRVLMRRHLGQVIANHEAARSGNPGAVHEMRIALTRLRTTILFFSPMVCDIKQAGIKQDLKWLNSQLGAIRDLDVAIERLASDQQQPRVTAYPAILLQKRKEGHRLLAQALQSIRYRRLIKSTSEWVETGAWSTDTSKDATKRRTLPVAEYSTGRLSRWRGRLLKKASKLTKMNIEKRHRLRLLNKKLTYSTEALDYLFSDKRSSKQRTELKYLRKAQKCLGELNDEVRGRFLPIALQTDGIRAPVQFLSSKREKRLLRGAAAAYRKLAKLSE